jgi:plasmid stabilization system protein ParE
MISIEIRDEAQAEIYTAVAFYEERRQGLGLQFLLSLDAVFERIRRQPRAFPVIDGSVRRAMLRRFPYAVIFDLEEDRATILAAFHDRRQPRGWSDRVSESVALDYQVVP